jgi:hypothetical protein
LLQETEENPQATEENIEMKSSSTETTEVSTQHRTVTSQSEPEKQEDQTSKSVPPPPKKPKAEESAQEKNKEPQFSFTPIVWNPPSSQSQQTTTTTQTKSKSLGSSHSSATSYDPLNVIPLSTAEEAVIRHNQSRTGMYLFFFVCLLKISPSFSSFSFLFVLFFFSDCYPLKTQTHSISVLFFVVKPSQRPPTNTLHIVGFVRPFTLTQVKALLSQHGTITNFWMNDVKSQCYVSVCRICSFRAVLNVFVTESFCSFEISTKL